MDGGILVTTDILTMSQQRLPEIMTVTEKGNLPPQ